MKLWKTKHTTASFRSKVFIGVKERKKEGINLMSYILVYQNSSILRIRHYYHKRNIIKWFSMVKNWVWDGSRKKGISVSKVQQQQQQQRQWKFSVCWYLVSPKWRLWALSLVKSSRALLVYQSNWLLKRSYWQKSVTQSQHIVFPCVTLSIQDTLYGLNGK